MKNVLLAAALVAASTGFVLAADPPMEPPVVVAPSLYDWSGFYVGVHGGGAWGTVPNTFDLDPPGPAFTAEPTYNASGWLLGVQAGANMQSGRFVLGLEGRVAWVGVAGNDGGQGGDVDTFDANFSASGLVKAGVALGDEGRVVPYLIGGVTALNYDYSLTIAPTTSVVNATAVGGSVGAGVAFAVTEDVSIFAEYLHTFYGTNTLQYAANGPIVAQRLNISPSIGTATIGVNFHF